MEKPQQSDDISDLIVIKTRRLCNAAINAGANEALRKRRKDQRSRRSRLSRACPSSLNTVCWDRFVSSIKMWRGDVDSKKLIQKNWELTAGLQTVLFPNFREKNHEKSSPFTLHHLASKLMVSKTLKPGTDFCWNTQPWWKTCAM